MPAIRPDRPRVGAVIVHFEAPDHLRSSVGSLQAGGLQPDRIVIVENSESHVAKNAGQSIADELGVEYVRSPHNVGFGAGCNAGAATISDCEQIFFLNQDAVVGVDTLERLSGLLDADDSLAAVNPRIDLNNGRLWFASGTFSARLARLTVPGQGLPADPAIDRLGAPLSTEWVNGCALLLRQSAWAAVGGFDECFFMYWEDVDLSLRLIDQGWNLGVDSRAVVVHDQGDDAGTKLTPTVIEHSIRSRRTFIRRRLTGPDRLTASAYTVVNVLGFVATSVRMKGRRAWPHLRAVFAGLRPRPAGGSVT